MESSLVFESFLGLMHEMHTDPKSEANLVSQTRDRSPRYEYSGR